MFVVFLDFPSFFLGFSYGFLIFPSPKPKKIQPLADFYRFLIVLLGWNMNIEKPNNVIMIVSSGQNQAGLGKKRLENRV